MSWTTMCWEYISYGRSLEDIFTSNDILWTTTQPAQCHLSFVREHRQEPSLWFNQLKQEDDLVWRLLHILGETSLMNCRRKTTDSAPWLHCYNISTQQIKYAHLHFQFIQTTSMTDCGSIKMPPDYPSKVYRIVHTHPCVYLKCIYRYAQIVFWLTFVSWFTSNISVATTRMHRAAAATVCTTIYIIYTTTLRKSAQTQLVIDNFRDKLIWRKTKSSSDTFASRDTEHIKTSTTSWFKGFSHMYKERKQDGQPHISSVKKDKDWHRRQQLIVIFAAGQLPHHSTAFLSGTEIKDPANEMSSAINKTHRQWDLRVSIKADIFMYISKIYRLR